jgi:hypothetical protein
MTTSVTGMVNHESIMTSAIKRMNESEMMVKIENQSSKNDDRIEMNQSNRIKSNQIDSNQYSTSSRKNNKKQKKESEEIENFTPKTSESILPTYYSTVATL